ncbi:unnamed protein product [Closterium sp. NIES-65]|nr:unnamed protein product [Closterium sp. NIES-65]
MYITLYYIVTRLPDSLRVVRDHFLSVCPTTLTVDLLEKALLAIQKSIVAVGASLGDPRTPVFEGCSPSPSCPLLPLLLRPTSLVSSRSALRLPRAGNAALAGARGARAQEGLEGAVEVVVEAMEGVGVVVGVVSGVAAAAAAVEEAEAVEVAERANAVEVAEVVEVEEAAEAAEVAAAVVLERVMTLRRGVAQVVVRASSSGVVASAAPGASASAAPDASESALSGTTSAQAFHTFTLDSGASRSFFRDRTTLTPLSRPVAVSLADPSGGSVLASLSTVLLCPAAPSGTLSGLYLPSFSTNLVSGADLQDRGVDQFTPASQRVTHCTCAWTGRHLATFTRRPGSSLYTLTTESPPVAESGQVAASSQVFAAGLALPGRERYFLLVVDDFSRYTTVFPLRSKGDVTEVSIDWIRAARLQLRESFGSDFLVLRLHSDRGGEFSSARLGAFCGGQGIRQTFTLPASSQQNGIAERRICMVMDVARTSMMHAAAPHFLWPFAVQYAMHQLNLQPQVSLPEASPALRWTGKVGDASAFRVWGSRAIVRDLSADKLSPRAVPCVFFGFPPDALGWQFYHPTSRRVSQVDAVEPVKVAVDSGAARGARSTGAGSGGAESGGAETGGAEPWGGEFGGAEPGGARSARVAAGGALSRREPLSPQELREWFARRWRRAAETGGVAWGVGAGVSICAGASGGATEPTRAGAAGAGAAGAGAAGGVGTGGAGGTDVSEATGAASPTGAGAAGAGAAGGVGAGGAAGAGASEGTGVGAVGAGGATGAGAAARGTRAVLAGSGGAARPRPYFVPLLEQRREPASHPASPVRAARTSGRTARPRPPAVPGTHQMALRPSTAPLRVPLPSPPESSLPTLADPESDSLCAASPSVTRLLASVVTDPSFESTAASALVAELVDFAARCRLYYATSLVAESESVCPPYVGGESALSTDVLEDRQEEFQCFVATLPHLVSTLIAPEGDPDAPDILTS